jgi:hypothetical protein
MTEPNSENPSDSGSENFPPPPPQTEPDDVPSSVKEAKDKLKLKPISRHLKNPHPSTDNRPEEFKPRIEIPRAVPIDPESGDIIEGGAAAAPIQPTQQAPAPSPPAPPPTDEPEAEPETENLVIQDRKRPNLLLVVGLPLILIVAILGLVHYLFDPLGLKLEPIVPSTGVPVARENQQAGAAKGKVSEIAVTPSVEIEEMPSDAFLEMLGNRKITINENPRGLFIDSVFFPVGSTLNAEYGFTIGAITIAKDESYFEITDAGGSTHLVIID